MKHTKQGSAENKKTKCSCSKRKICNEQPKLPLKELGKEEQK